MSELNPMLSHLEAIFKEVRDYLLKKGYTQTGIQGLNVKKTDISRGFDIMAENIAVKYCKDHNLPVKIFTEEKGVVNITSSPEHIIIFDPVDGSTNFSRGIEGSAFASAVAPYNREGIIKPGDVCFALTGSIISGAVCKGEKGRGVFYKKEPFTHDFVKVFGSKNENLDGACIEIDLDFGYNEARPGIDAAEKDKIKRVLPLIRRIKHIRRTGSSAIGLMDVATGAIDAFVDVRDISTPENWVGAYLLITEAGGAFTDPFGGDMPEIRDMKIPHNLVASGNPVLHRKILKALDTKEV